MVSDRFGESLSYPLSGYSASGWEGAGLCQPALALAAALDSEPSGKVSWKVLDRAHLLLLRVPERKKLKGEAVVRPQAGKTVVSHEEIPIPSWHS